MDPSAVGTTAESDYEYDWPRVVDYALAVGVKRDELDYVYRARGPKVIPTFILVAGYVPTVECFGPLGGVFPMEVHGGQSLRVHRAIPPEGKVHTVVRVDGIYDRGSFAQVVLGARHTMNGELVADAVWSTLWRADGGFGGPRPPARVVPEPPDGADPDWVVDDPSSPEQALHYSVFGDHNPTHIDPEWARQAGFEQGTILQGLCTMGFVARAAIEGACGGDPARLRYIDVEFRRNVHPGEVISTRGWRLPDGRVAIRAYAGDRPEPAVSNAWIEVSPSAAPAGP